MDIKNVMVELGNRLIERKFNRSNLQGTVVINQSTEYIDLFLTWLDSTPEVQQVLLEMGMLDQKKKHLPFDSCGTFGIMSVWDKQPS